MKKKILPLLLVCVLIIGLSATAMAEETSSNTDLPTPGVWFLPENLPVSEVWAGDYMVIVSGDYKYEVVEGAEIVEFSRNGMLMQFLKTGTVKIEVTSKENPEDTRTFDIPVIPAKDSYVEYLLPKTMKIGHKLFVESAAAYIYHNCLLDGEAGDNLHGYCKSSMTYDDEHAHFINVWSYGGSDSVDTKTRTYQEYSRYGFASRPGEYRIAAKRDVETPYIVTIEEPVININLPKRVQVGTEMQLTTSLDNTELENMKVEDVNKWELSPDCPVPWGYQPKVEIVSGAELVERGEGDYSNILNSSEQIKFIGEGTVEFKVVYDMLRTKKIESEYFDEAVYSPEKTFSVEVVSELPDSGEVSDQTSNNIKADTSGLSWDSICENNQVDLGNDLEVTLKQEEAAKEDASKLEQQAGKEGYSVKTVYEILLTLYSDGDKVADLTEGFGKLKLSLQVGAEFAGKNATVYQLHNNSEVITHKGLTVNADGTVTITVDKLSTFAVAVADGNATQTPSTGTDNKTTGNTTQTNANSNSVNTGDSANMMLWFTVCILSAAVVVVMFLMKKRRFRTIK